MRKRGTSIDRTVTRVVFLIACASCVTAVALLWFRQAHSPANERFYYFGTYVSALAFGATLYASAFFWPVKAQVILSIATVYLALNAYALEAVFDVQELMRIAGSRRSLLSQIRATRPDAVPALVPKYWVATDGLKDRSTMVFPLAGLSNRTTVTCKEGRTEGVYLSDEHGFANPSSTYRKGAADAVLIGDSYVHGDCVGPDDNIAGHLRARGLRVLNLGMRGSGPLIELAILKEYAAVLQPKRLIWVFYEGNDIDDLAIERTSSSLLHYVDGAAGQHLIDRQPEIDHDALTRFLAEQERLVYEDDRYEREHDWKRIGGQFARLSLLRQRLGLNKPSRRPDTDPALWSLLDATLAQAHDTVRSWGGSLTFVYFPVYPPTRDKMAAELYGSYREHVWQILRRRGIDVFDLEPVFRHGADPKVMVACDGCHLTPKGYSFVADAIAPLITPSSQAAR